MNVVCVGDCGVDRYPDQDRPGGITLNFAAHARRLFPVDDRIIVVSALGTDDEAHTVTDAIDELPVEAFLAGMPGRTSIQFIDLEPSGEKIFVKYDQGVLGDYRVGERERALIAEADLLMTPHYRQIDGFFDSVMQSPSRGLRAVDFADIAEYPTTETVEKYVDCFDLAFFGLATKHGAFIDELHALAARAGKLFVVTLGADGSEALSKDERLTCPAAPVARVVDTTGAGDTFAAAFLCEYCSSKDVARSLARGAAEAAKTISRLGAF
jgi:fructoselysine 6-kinase